MKDSIIKRKTYDFALKIIEIYRQLISKDKEYILARQILRSGTSIGANVEESIGGQSRKDFAAKMAIAYKEARETCYWIRLLMDAGFMSQAQGDELLSECNEIIRIIAAIRITTQKNS